jgi:hypothetical protein
LSRIARDVGRLDEASVWVSRALTVEEKDCDAGVCLGDLYAYGQKWEEAKRCYEKNNTKVRKRNFVSIYYIDCIASS